MGIMIETYTNTLFAIGMLDDNFTVMDAIAEWPKRRKLVNTK